MTPKRPGLAFYVYRGAAGLMRIAAPAFLRRRAARGKEDRQRHREKLAEGMAPRPDGALVWLHCASVGELNASMALIRRLSEASHRVLVTTVTYTSGQLAGSRLPDGVIHQYAPLDIPSIISRFLDHWRPSTALMMESELWPNTIHALHLRGVAIAIVNGRLSDRSSQRWRLIPSLIGPMLQRVHSTLCQTAEDASRFAHFGAGRVQVTGNLKFDAATPSIDRAALKDLRERIGERRVFLAASVHPGEEDAILNAHAECLLAEPHLLTIIAPRHPDKAAVFIDAARRRGLPVATRLSAADMPPLAGASVFVAGTIGELGLLYSLAHVALIGGSLIPHGGQNPIEAAKLEVPILFGPHVQNFTEIYASFRAAGAAIPIADSAALPGAILRVLSDPQLSIEMQRQAARLVKESAGALDRTLVALRPILPPAKQDPA